MIAKMTTGGRFTDNTLPPGTSSSNTIFISPPLSTSYPTQPTQPSYHSASTLPTQFRRIHARAFFRNQTLSTVSAPKETLDTTTRIMLYFLFFIMSCCALFSLAYFLNYIFKLHVTKLQKRYNYESYREFEGLITRRIFFRYRTFDVASPYDAEENGRRPVSSAGSTENWEYTNPVNDTKATKAIIAIKAIKATKVAGATKAVKAIKATKDSKAAKATKATKDTKATKATKKTDSNHNEPEWESAQPSHPTTPNRRKVGFANLPRPIRRPPTSKQPAGLKFAASPPRPTRQNRPKRLRSPPLPPDFLTISNATTAPMAIPGQEPSSWIVGLPWVTAADGPITRDEGKKDRDMDPDDDNWADIDRVISNDRDQYASDKKILDAARRKDGEVKRENGFVQSRKECNNCSTSSESFWAY